MTDGGWAHESSPFHAGEQAVQERLGVRDKLERFGRRVIRDYMPEQHREFFRMLPLLVIGTVDREGWPWASILAGPAGFVTSPGARSLRIAARPLAGDPLEATLHEGADVGILGIQLETRRRNRLTGRVVAVTEDGFEVAVRQSFGNCPQYIQTRAVTFEPRHGAAAGRPAHRRDQLDGCAKALIEHADTLFIATAYADGTDDPAKGADVSHRGGKPGFVQVEDDRTLVFPDYSGNLHFNTIGNIELDPRAGLLFIDFDRGDLVYLTARAEVVWEGEAVRAFAGAERLLRFHVEQMIRVGGRLPLRFAFGEYSPFVEATGSWSEALETIASNRQRDTFIDYEVFKVEAESETIRSFYLRRIDGKALAGYEAGQFLPIRLAIPRTAEPVLRTYTVSDGPNRKYYRLSVKREAGGLVSNFLHDHAAPGFRLEAMAPRGIFVIDAAAARPVVLISGGVGITPMVAMTNHLINEGRRTRSFRRTFFIHGTTNGRALAFGRHLRSLARVHESLTLHIRFSQPSADDRLGETHDSVGRLDLDLLKGVLAFDDYDFYLCGPTGFMQSLYEGLTGLGVREERIHYESFGPATVLKHDQQEQLVPPARIASDPVPVRFALSNVEVEWSPGKGTLLELAEAAGLAPNFGCRSGVCGTCATRITCGAVDYLETPVGPRSDGEALICCATPRSTSGPDTCGDRHGVILDI
jgi:ferredoxin-NADP reductase/predicted pyridoxine 5'-phosphate oxidase superfamily flavin-nucleotide-binding protein